MPESPDLDASRFQPEVDMNGHIDWASVWPADSFIPGAIYGISGVRDRQTIHERFLELPAEQVEIARGLFRDYPDAVPFDEIASRGLTVNDMALVESEDARLRIKKLYPEIYPDMYPAYSSGTVPDHPESVGTADFDALLFEESSGEDNGHSSGMGY